MRKFKVALGWVLLTAPTIAITAYNLWPHHGMDAALDRLQWTGVYLFEGTSAAIIGGMLVVSNLPKKP